MNFSDQLQHIVEHKKSSLILHFDASFKTIPDSFSLDAESIAEYGLWMCEVLQTSIAGIRVDISVFEQFGWEGFQVLERFLKSLKNMGIFVILDINRSGNEKSMALYAKTYTDPISPLSVHAVTVNAYFGSESMRPFIEACENYGAGVFVTVRTDNESASEFQSGSDLCVRIAEKIEDWNISTQSTQNMYASIGASVSSREEGALKFFREEMPHAWIMTDGITTPEKMQEGLSIQKNGLGVLFCITLDTLMDGYECTENDLKLSINRFYEKQGV